MSLRAYVLVVVALVAGSLGLLWPVLKEMEAGTRQATLLGGALAGVNALLAYVLLLWAETRRTTGAFLGAVLGGMLGRMGLLLIAVVVAVVGFGVPKVPLAVSLLSYFVVLLALEISVLHRRTPRGEACP